eukprot:gene30409-40400_t
MPPPSPLLLSLYPFHPSLHPNTPCGHQAQLLPPRAHLAMPMLATIFQNMQPPPSSSPPSQPPRPPIHSAKGDNSACVSVRRNLVALSKVRRSSQPDSETNAAPNHSSAQGGPDPGPCDSCVVTYELARPYSTNLGTQGNPDLRACHRHALLQPGASRRPHQQVARGQAYILGIILGDKIYGMDLFYKGWTGSSYSKIATQYSGPNGAVSGSITYGGYVVDSSTPTTATDTGTILNEVCAQIPNPDPSGNGYYVVYTERPRGTAGYCGWHSYGYCGNVLVQIAFIFNLDNDSDCGGTTSASLIPVNAGWTMNSGRMSAGVHALAGVSAHELTEMITDPRLDAWYDSTGEENADKCAWTFPPSNTLLANGITWRISGDWSNSAALAGTGYQTYSYSYSLNVYGCVGGV